MSVDVYSDYAERLRRYGFTEDDIRAVMGMLAKLLDAVDKDMLRFAYVMKMRIEELAVEYERTFNETLAETYPAIQGHELEVAEEFGRDFGQELAEAVKVELENRFKRIIVEDVKTDSSVDREAGRVHGELYVEVWFRVPIWRGAGIVFEPLYFLGVTVHYYVYEDGPRVEVGEIYMSLPERVEPEELILRSS